MLAVSRRSPLRLEEYVAREVARSHRFLKVGKLPKMARRSLRDIGHRAARERRSVIAVQAPTDALLPKSRKDARRREYTGCRIRKVPKGSRHMYEGAIRKRLGRCGRVPVIAHRITLGKIRENWQQRGRIHTHNLRSRGSRQHLVCLF